MFDGQPGVTRNSSQGEGIYRIVPGNGENTSTVCHHDMLALAHGAKSGLLERAHGVKVLDPGDFCHALDRDFDFPNVSALDLVLDNL